MFEHYTVLKEETVNGVLNDLSGIYVDGTLGGAGHTKYLLSLLNEDAKVIAFDQDLEAIKNAKKINDDRLILIHSNFKNLVAELKQIGILKINGLILDLGFSSPQIDNSERGFSYMQDGPLDMRMDKRQDKTAKDIVNNYTPQELKKILFNYGEEKNANLIVKSIIKYRENKEIETTLELVDVIEKSLPMKIKKQKGHSAKKTFQALRIEVNDELKVLKNVLDDAYEILDVNGRLSIISFHSLEDKIVKYKFKKESEIDKDLRGLPEIPKEYLPKANMINKKPILPKAKEIKENTRSMSAKLRILKKYEK